jgi:hypothetical protein
MLPGWNFSIACMHTRTYIHTYNVEEAADRAVSEVSSGVLVGSLFYEAVSVTTGKDLVRSCCSVMLRYYPGIRLEGRKKATKNLNQDSRSPGARFEPWTSRIRRRSVNKSTTTFGVVSSVVVSCVEESDELYSPSIHAMALQPKSDLGLLP